MATDAQLETYRERVAQLEEQAQDLRDALERLTNAYGSKLSELDAANQELRRIRKLLRKALGR
jgi:predicted  nucleic acid-binding Zn-ribbon protein